MRRMVSKTLLVIGTLGAVTVAGACGHPGVTNASSHGLRWEIIPRAFRQVPPVTLWPALVWYNNCTREVQWYVSYGTPDHFTYPRQYDNDTLFFWNGSQWRPLKVTFSLHPAIGVVTWDSNDCRLVDIGFTTGVPAAQSRPGQVLNPTWIWDGSSWRIASVTSPALLYGEVMVYDPASRDILLFGQSSQPVREDGTWPVPEGNAYQIIHQIGQIYLEQIKLPHFTWRTTPSRTSSTWTFNGWTWVEQHLDNGPPVVNGFSAVYDEGPLAVYDPATRTVVLFGGGTNPMLVNAQSTRKPGAPLFVESKPVYDTWLWNGVTWTKADVKDNPQVDTTYSAMAYDPLLKGVVLYDTQSRATWLWNGNDWKRLRTTNTMSPESGYNPSMVFDASTGQMILTGGAAHRSTWVLAGSIH